MYLNWTIGMNGKRNGIVDFGEFVKRQQAVAQAELVD
jgi:hypothetical protein